MLTQVGSTMTDADWDTILQDPRRASSESTRRRLQLAFALYSGLPCSQSMAFALFRSMLLRPYVENDFRIIAVAGLHRFENVYLDLDCVSRGSWRLIQLNQNYGIDWSSDNPVSVTLPYVRILPRSEWLGADFQGLHINAQVDERFKPLLLTGSLSFKSPGTPVASWRSPICLPLREHLFHCVPMTVLVTTWSHV